GLVFRHSCPKCATDSDGKDDYGFFGLLKNGGCRILEVHHSGIYQLYETSSPAFNSAPGAPNHLGVAAIRPDFVFLVNDQVVAQMNADIDAGQIGLGIDTLTKASEAQVDFDDLQINAP